MEYVFHAWACFLAGLVIILLGCKDDSSANLPADFTFDGSYYVVEITITADNKNFTTYRHPDVYGVLNVSGGTFNRDVVITEKDRWQDSGTVSVSENVIILYPDDLMGSEQVGVYDLENEWIRLNYALDNYLYTEIWRRVRPLDVEGLEL